MDDNIKRLFATVNEDFLKEVLGKVRFGSGEFSSIIMKYERTFLDLDESHFYFNLMDSSMFKIDDDIYVLSHGSDSLLGLYPRYIPYHECHVDSLEYVLKTGKFIIHTAAISFCSTNYIEKFFDKFNIGGMTNFRLINESDLPEEQHVRFSDYFSFEPMCSQ